MNEIIELGSKRSVPLYLLRIVSMKFTVYDNGK